MGIVDWLTGTWDRTKDFFADKIRSFLGVGDTIAKDIGEQSSYDRDRASVDQSVAANQLLADLRNQSKDKADKIEGEIIEAIRQVFKLLEEGIQTIDNKTIGSVPLDLPMGQIQSAYKKSMLSISVQGVLMRDLTPKLSIGNKECLKILKLKAGKDKEAEMRNFINKSFKESSSLLGSDVEKKSKIV
ncbi:MAG: hypothetical protein MR025_09565 [Helicobacter trogontum]|nr:hypothetical protein [Helicobacter trogontum]MCI5787666.1 hypothetical protein [Helicobacter trogontum]